MRRLGAFVVLLIGVLLTNWLVVPVLAQEQVCEPASQTAREIAPGVTLTWDGAFHCADVPAKGRYQIVVWVVNEAKSAESVTVEAVRLSHTTPRPRGQAPDATAEAKGLPLVVAPGERATFTVSGDYTLVKTGESGRANLHLRVTGRTNASLEPFVLGINVHLEEPAGEEPEEGELVFVHPALVPVARFFDVPYEQVAAWHSQGFGVGNIARALFLARMLENMSAEELLEAASERGWGDVMKEYGVHPGTLRSGRNLGAIRSGRAVTETTRSPAPMPFPAKPEKPKGAGKHPPDLNKTPPGLQQAPNPSQAPGHKRKGR